MLPFLLPPIRARFRALAKKSGASQSVNHLEERCPAEDLPLMDRIRIARTSDESTLSTLLQAALASNARLEMVCKNGSRWPIALRLDRVSLCSLIQLTRPGSDARLELVISRFS